MREHARNNGFLQTMSGRRRWLPEINTSNWEKRGHAERVAVNGTVQGWCLWLGVVVAVAVCYNFCLLL